jgi:hypothetical protein
LALGIEIAPLFQMKPKIFRFLSLLSPVGDKGLRSVPLSRLLPTWGGGPTYPYKPFHKGGKAYLASMLPGILFCFPITKSITLSPVLALSGHHGSSGSKIDGAFIDKISVF